MSSPRRRVAWLALGLAAHALLKRRAEGAHREEIAGVMAAGR